MNNSTTSRGAAKPSAAKRKPRDAALQDAIDAAGGVARLGQLLDVSSQAISQWARCPARRVLAVEAATGMRVPRHRLRPDLYPAPGAPTGGAIGRAGAGAPTGARGTLPDLAGRLGAARVLCVGDVMLDKFVTGTVERISPEAPIPVLKVARQSAMLGGAGNVARNLAGLGARAQFIAAVGADPAGAEVARLLDGLSGIDAALIEMADRPTSIKTRYVAGAQQLMRADEEITGPLPRAAARALVKSVRAALKACDVVVLSDYGKGVLDDKTVADVIAAAAKAGRPVIVDPKGRDYGRYRGAALLTPNRAELAHATGLPVDDDAAIVAACRHLIETAGVGAVLATRSSEGMTLLADGAEPVHLGAEAREVFDVSGAGDTVIATVAAALAVGAAPGEAAQLANVAAGIVVGKVGTAALTADELIQALHHQDFAGAEAKILTLPQALDAVALWRAQGRTVGFTNGCFDILHPGHVSLLAQARGACDRLVLGLNSDASVRRLKGPSRPVNSEGARATVLAALGTVDAVVIFGEDTPFDLIAALQPDVLVKGADYTEDQVVGADVVRRTGGRVVLADLVAGQSTTSTIGRMTRGAG
jgi:D-beta-D-heptose 7-phosphate kinase/D-beta-D-heptose 1-phosphate adenosyltransferase